MMVISKNRKRLFFVAAVFFLMTTVLSVVGCGKSAKTNKKNDYINYISFSHDGKKILFDRQKGEGPYLLNVYDLETGELSAYQSPPDEQWTMARYSFDGNHIVFSVYPRKEDHLDLDKMQLAIMEPDGKNIRRITNTSGPKIFPSFSHSGDKVIFANAGTVRKSGRTPAADFDVYEIDIMTGKETQLTRFKFFELHQPFYLPDDKTFIFSADYPSLDLGEMRKELNSRYQYNLIYKMQSGEQTLKPYFEFYAYSSRPMLSADGKCLFFRSRGNPVTNGGSTQFYLFSSDGRHRRITNKVGWSVLDSAVSPDGEKLAVVCEIDEGTRIVIYRVQDGSSKEVFLPDNPSRIINPNPN
jgi:Tol biopolymer transport system component